MTPNGRERIMEVRAGEKGTGAVLGCSIGYWPWSDRSYEEADRLISYQIELAEAGGYDVIVDGGNDE
jgi:hypothetical protein